MTENENVCPTCGKLRAAPAALEEDVLRTRVLKLRQRLKDLDRGGASSMRGEVSSFHATGDEKKLEERITECLDHLSGGYGSGDE